MGDKNLKTVYLAGLISTEKAESLSWRVEAADRLHEQAVILSPMRGKENLMQTSKDGGVTDPFLTSRDIIFRDYWDIRQSDVLLTCLDDFGNSRPLVGTLMELAWAWEARKPVVAFAATPLMLNHPFVKESVGRYCADLDEAIDILVRHYLK